MKLLGCLALEPRTSSKGLSLSYMSSDADSPIDLSSEMGPS